MSRPLTGKDDEENSRMSNVRKKSKSILYLFKIVYTPIFLMKGF